MLISKELLASSNFPGSYQYIGLCPTLRIFCPGNQNILGHNTREYEASSPRVLIPGKCCLLKQNTCMGRPIVVIEELMWWVEEEEVDKIKRFCGKEQLVLRLLQKSYFLFNLLAPLFPAHLARMPSSAVQALI